MIPVKPYAPLYLSPFLFDTPVSAIHVYALNAQGVNVGGGGGVVNRVNVGGGVVERG